MSDKTFYEKHRAVVRDKRPDWVVCDFDSMTWPCDTRKVLDANDTLTARLAAVEGAVVAFFEVWEGPFRGEAEQVRVIRGLRAVLTDPATPLPATSETTT